MTVLQLAAKLLIFIGIGFFGRRLKVMGDGFDRQLSRFLMAIPLPCMIINSFRLEFSPARLAECPHLVGLSVLSMVLCFAAGQVLYLAMGRTGQGKAARFSAMFTNFTFFGFSVVSELYGAEATFVYVIFTLFIRICFYGGAPVLVGNGSLGLDIRQALRQFISPPVAAVFIGLALYVAQLSLPSVLTSVITTLGNMASPLGLMLCGIIIADASFKGIRKYRCVFWLTGLRLILIPTLMIGLFLLLGIEHDTVRALSNYFTMPVASFLPTFFLRYAPEDTDARSMAGFLVVTSTLFCIVTIPLWALVLEHIL